MTAQLNHETVHQGSVYVARVSGILTAMLAGTVDAAHRALRNNVALPAHLSPQIILMIYTPAMTVCGLILIVSLIVSFVTWRKHPPLTTPDDGRKAEQ